MPQKYTLILTYNVHTCSHKHTSTVFALLIRPVVRLVIIQFVRSFVRSPCHASEKYYWTLQGCSLCFVTMLTTCLTVPFYLYLHTYIYNICIHMCAHSFRCTVHADTFISWLSLIAFITRGNCAIRVVWVAHFRSWRHLQFVLSNFTSNCAHTHTSIHTYASSLVVCRLVAIWFGWFFSVVALVMLYKCAQIHQKCMVYNLVFFFVSAVLWKEFFIWNCDGVIIL